MVDNRSPKIIYEQSLEVTLQVGSFMNMVAILVNFHFLICKFILFLFILLSFVHHGSCLLIDDFFHIV